MDSKDIITIQEAVCQKFNSLYRKLEPADVIGIGEGLEDGLLPINGLRHPATDGQTGWYIWGGEYSDKENFFKPMHAKHILEKYPELAPYLGLDYGWRFLIDPATKYEDVWEDKSLLDI